jgi:hypothetical protein
MLHHACSRTYEQLDEDTSALLLQQGSSSHEGIVRRARVSLSPRFMANLVRAGLLLGAVLIGMAAGSALQGRKAQALNAVDKLDRTKLAVIIETRDLPALPTILLNFLERVPPEWPFQIFCSNETALSVPQNHFIAPYIASGKLVIKVLANAVDLRDGPALSQFLTTPIFWRALAPAENLFFFQTDSIICARSNDTLNDFLGLDVFDGGYDWVGAVWTHLGYPFPNTPWGGNGGFSLRRRSTLLSITEQFDWDGEPEVREPLTPIQVSPDLCSDSQDLWFTYRINETTRRFPEQPVSMNFALVSCSGTDHGANSDRRGHPDRSLSTNGLTGHLAGMLVGPIYMLQSVRTRLT